MSYEKHNYQSGAKLFARQLNEMDDQIAANEERSIELNNELTQTNNSLDMLWKLSKGQTYDLVDKVESGMNIAPKGAQYETLIDVRGNSTQGENPSPDNPQTITSVEELNFEINGKNLASTIIRGYCNSASTFVYNTNVTSVLFYGIKDKTYVLSSPSAVANRNDVGYSEEKPTNLTVTGYVFQSHFNATIANGYSTFTPNKNGWYLWYFSNTKVDNVQLEVGAIPTSYEPYHEETRQILPPFALNKIGDVFDFVDVENKVYHKNIKTITEADYSHSIVNEPEYFILSTPTTEPISETVLEFLESLHNLVTSENVITITDQNGNDISYLMEYIVKLNEVN